MKTSVIRHRVADFLKQHPPFDVLPEEDLLELAGTGRVTFHESDEYLFHKGQATDALIRVIQQGKVEMVDGERVRDVLGEGEILGLDYSHSAKTASDVILYSVDARAFEDLVTKHEEMRRYVAAHFPKHEVTWLDAEAPPLELLRLQTCNAGTPIREIASQDGDFAVIDPEGRPLGLVTDREIRGSIALGEAPCGTIMNSRIPAARAGLGIAACALEMMRARSRNLWITADGSIGSPLQGVMRDSDLALACGRNPVVLMQEMLGARTARELERLRRYRDALIAESLAGPDAVDLVAPIAAQLDGAFVEAVIRIASESRKPPDIPFCWLLFGRAGRGECLAPEFPSIGVVYADSPAAEEYFSSLLPEIQRQFAACGLQGPAPQGLSLSGWKQYYGELIANPIVSGIYSVRSMFDFRPLLGDHALALALEESIATELEVADIFIPVLANDTLAHLPPMTFFQGLVVELDGAQGSTLDIESYALQPVEDAARVFALAGRRVSPTNTLDRLEGDAAVLVAAREAFRIASFHCAKGNAVVDPSRLSKYDQRLLKTAFQSIRRLLEFTASRFTAATQL